MDMQIKLPKTTFLWIKIQTRDHKSSRSTYLLFLSKTHGTFKLNYYKIKKFNTYFEQFFEHYLDHLILLRVVAKFEDTFRCKGLFGTLLLKNCTICNNGSQENLEIEFNY